MKKIILLLLVTFNLFAQKSIKVSYEEITTFKESFFDALPENDREFFKKKLNSPKKFELINNGDYSLYHTIDEKDEKIPSNELPEAGVINQGTIFKALNIWILKDFISLKTFERRELEDSYYLENDFRKENFMFTDEEKTIDNYKCKMAYILNVKKPTDTIKYWYTPEIPILDGPYYTVGLPGLVLRYEREQRVIYATKIEYLDKKVSIERLDSKIKIITDADFKFLYNESLKLKNYTDEKGNIHNVESKIYKNN